MHSYFKKKPKKKQNKKTSNKLLTDKTEFDGNNKQSFVPRFVLCTQFQYASTICAKVHEQRSTYYTNTIC